MTNIFLNGPNSWSWHLFLKNYPCGFCPNGARQWGDEALSGGEPRPQTNPDSYWTFSYHSVAPHMCNLSQPVPTAVNTLDEVRAGWGNQSEYWSLATEHVRDFHPAHQHKPNRAPPQRALSCVAVVQHNSMCLCRGNHLICRGALHLHVKQPIGYYGRLTEAEMKLS